MAVASGPAGPVLAGPVFTLALKIAQTCCALSTANPASVPTAQDIMISGINCPRTTMFRKLYIRPWNVTRGKVGGGA